MTTTTSRDQMNLVKKGDYHCWVVDKSGKVVNDPYFSLYDFVRKIHGCPSKEMHYKEFPTEVQKLAWKFIKENKMPITKTKGWAKAFYKTPQVNHCPYNAAAFVIKNKGKGYRIAVGSMGWKSANSIWWEFG